MKKLISLCLVGALVLGNVSFAASNAPKPTSTTPPAPVITAVKPPTNFVIGEAKDASSDFSKAFLHTAKNFEPYEFELTESDFATSKWQKYVAAVYIQATDVNYYVSTLYADGSLKQVVSLTSEDVQKIIDDAKTSNEAIKAESVSKPDASFTPFFKNVYQAPWMLISENDLITYKNLSKYDIPNMYPDLIDKLYNSFKVYKKGSFYILMIANYPLGTWSSVVSSATTELDTALGKTIAKNTELLVAAKLIEAPKPVVVDKQKVTTPAPSKVFYVLIINKDKTYTLKEFKTAEEAKKFQTLNAKKLGKANVLYFDVKANLDKTITKLKLKKSKK